MINYSVSPVDDNAIEVPSLLKSEHINLDENRLAIERLFRFVWDMGEPLTADTPGQTYQYQLDSLGRQFDPELPLGKAIVKHTSEFGKPALFVANFLGTTALLRQQLADGSVENGFVDVTMNDDSNSGAEFVSINYRIGSNYVVNLDGDLLLDYGNPSEYHRSILSLIQKLELDRLISLPPPAGTRNVNFGFSELDAQHLTALHRILES